LTSTHENIKEERKLSNHRIINSNIDIHGERNDEGGVKIGKNLL
jgi:hypothetical protein